MEKDNYAFTTAEMQYIVNVLVTRPFNEVADLLANIKVQHDATQAAKVPEKD